jgi:ABC-2 type transport system permease protein
MRKYLQVIKITFQEYFVYRLNFLFWRLRAFIQLLVLYFLWLAVIPQGTTIFGYDQAKILTYILGTSIIRSFILASRSVDAAGQIGSGDISNFLLKPISYLKYWFAKDLTDKILNLIFSIFGVSLIFILLRPPVIIQTNPVTIGLTILSIILGIILYFYLSFLLSMIAFWTPENVWPPRFLATIIIEFLAGGLFPLDILPAVIFNSLQILPFTYLLFFPLNIYLGKLALVETLFGLVVSLFWIVIFYQLVKLLFHSGVKKYAAWGR